jgi:hypothetical protein
VGESLRARRSSCSTRAVSSPLSRYASARRVASSAAGSADSSQRRNRRVHQPQQATITTQGRPSLPGPPSANPANGQLAFGACLREARPDAAQANSLLVLTLTGSRIQAMTRFEGRVMSRFSLPPS